FVYWFSCVFFFQAEDGIRDRNVTGVQTCALPILCEIAADSFTSSNTIIRSLENVENNFKVNCNWLPSHLSFDDFKSGKRFSSSGMCMCLINAFNHRIIVIILDSNNKLLSNYYIH